METATYPQLEFMEELECYMLEEEVLGLYVPKTDAYIPAFYKFQNNKMQLTPSMKNFLKSCYNTGIETYDLEQIFNQKVATLEDMETLLHKTLWTAYETDCYKTAKYKDFKVITQENLQHLKCSETYKNTLPLEKHLLEQLEKAKHKQSKVSHFKSELFGFKRLFLFDLCLYYTLLFTTYALQPPTLKHIVMATLIVLIIFGDLVFPKVANNLYLKVSKEIANLEVRLNNETYRNILAKLREE